MHDAPTLLEAIVQISATIPHLPIQTTVKTIAYQSPLVCSARNCAEQSMILRLAHQFVNFAQRTNSAPECSDSLRACVISDVLDEVLE